MPLKHALYFSKNLPIKNNSAACERVFSMIDKLTRNNYYVTFIAPSNKQKKDLVMYSNVRLIVIDPNDQEAMRNVFRGFKSIPEYAIFDTFVAEEFYSHYVYKTFPATLRILDTQDLHSLRKCREDKYNQCIKEQNTIKDLRDILKEKPDPSQSIFARELSSIYRSDLAILVSDYERLLLQDRFNVYHTLTSRFTYAEDSYKERNCKLTEDEFSKRKNFVWLGNFMHPPNVASLRYLLNQVWPQVRRELPKAELHIYGSNFSKDFEDIEKHPNVKKKNLMKDIAELSKYRCMLAPLVYGAGIKG